MEPNNGGLVQMISFANWQLFDFLLAMPVVFFRDDTTTYTLNLAAGDVAGVSEIP